jgi:membrane associated rhomboid family serine protease
VATHHQYYRLVTSMFLHINLLHIVMNMIALISVGPYLERLLGPPRYVAVYLLGGLGGSVAVYLLGARFSPVVGASGAIFGLFAACLIVVRDLRIDPWLLIANIVLNFAITFSIPDISKLGHLGGFVVGAAAGLAIAGLPHKRSRLPRRVQLAGLAAIFLLLLGAVAWRTNALQPHSVQPSAASSTRLDRAPGLDHRLDIQWIGAQRVATQHDQ